MTHDDLLSDPYVAAYPELLPFWQAAGQGVLLLPWCTACGQTHWHPQGQCPFCRCPTLRWEAASGRATLHTFTAIARRDAATDLLAYVALQEGPLVLTRIVEADAAQLRIGMPLQVRFHPTPQGRCAPCFAPAEDQAVPDALPQ